MNVFISYTREKDDTGWVSHFRQNFQRELKFIQPDATVFQDRQGIKVGDDFLNIIAKELKNSDVLLILFSPAWLKSEWCRKEFDLFFEKEEGDRPGKTPRILPLLWVGKWVGMDPGGDHIAQQLARLNYVDWTVLRHRKMSDVSVSKGVAELAERAEKLGSE